MTRAYDTATSKAPHPDDEALWCKPCAAETWHRSVEVPLGVSLATADGRSLPVFGVEFHCRNPHKLELVR